MFKVLLEDKTNLSLDFLFFLLTCMNFIIILFSLEKDRFSLICNIVCKKIIIIRYIYFIKTYSQLKYTENVSMIKKIRFNERRRQEILKRNER